MPASRPVSGLEAKWLAAHHIQPPFAIDFVAELAGALDPTELERAWSAVIAAHPGLRVRLQGRFGRRRWVADGPVPPVVWQADQTWDATRFLPASELSVSLDPDVGPVALLAVRRAPDGAHTLVLRVLHAVTDGRGGLAVLADLFAALRGESLAGPHFPTLIDADISRGAGGVSAPAPVPDRAPHARGPAHPGQLGGGWTRLTLSAPSAAVYASVVLALARWPRSGRLRYTLPVDLRRHRPDLPETVGNLTGLVHLDVSEFAAASDGLERFGAVLREAVAQGLHHGPVLEAEGMRRMPMRLLSGAGGMLSRRDQRRGLVPASATVSNIGRLDLSRWSTPSVQARSVFVGPPASPGLPLLLVMTGNADRIELAGAVPAAWGSPSDWQDAFAEWPVP